MFKRSAANYSLWPEQRQRRGRPLKFAAGSFVLGVVCATAYGTLFSFTEPATGQGFKAQRAVEPVPIVIAREAPAPAAVPMPPPKPDEIANRPSRTRAAAAKVTLPLIGAPSPTAPTATDGRGDDGLTGEVRLTGPEPAADDTAGLLGGERELVREAPAQRTDTAVKPTMAAPTAVTPAAVVPTPVAAPVKTTTTKAVEPTSRGMPEKQEPVHEPQVTQAPSAKTRQAAPVVVRNERPGVVVLAKRAAPANPATAAAAAGGDEVLAGAPAPRSDSAKAAAAPTELPATRRGHVVVVKQSRKQPAIVARGDDAPVRKPVVRTSTPKRVLTASKRPAAAHQTVARKSPTKPTRYAAKSPPKRETATRQARRRQDPLGPMIARATEAFRAFAGSQGFGLSGF